MDTSMAALTMGQRLAGGLVGLLVGDALGVPYEFHPARALPGPEQIEMVPPVDFPRSHDYVEPGTWSDDGAQALCLLASLQYRQHFDIDDFGRRLLNWCDHGYMAVGGEVFDIGISTSQAMSRLRAGIPASRSGLSAENSNGNGSLMRVLPLALWHGGTDAELAADARSTSLLTHAHLRSQLCCALYCLWARRIMGGSDDPWSSAVETMRSLYAAVSPEREELDGSIVGSDLRGGSGYVVDCLHSARWAVTAGTYEAAVKAAIRLGDDTDTTACVTGGIAGLLYGLDAIPMRWRNALMDFDIVEPMIQKLLDWSGC
jgi:ADP-ribosylglycohydrolase